MTMMKRMAIALAATASFTAGAEAGGFSRGSANLDGLFASEYRNEPIIGSAGVTVVAPGRSYDTLTTVIGTNTFTQRDVEFGNTFAVPFASVGLQLHDRARCVGSYSQPYGGDSSYSGAARFQVSEQTIDTYEIGGTCSVGVDVGRGTAYAIGGVFYEHLTYKQRRNFTALFGPFAPVNPAFGALPDSSIDVSSTDIGYRLGIAYEIPEIALRASLMYRSETNHEVTGAFRDTDFANLTLLRLLSQGVNPQTAIATATGAFGGTFVPIATAPTGGIILGGTQSAGAFGSADLPRQVELNLRTGVAPGTLVFGSVKWTDWSVIQRIDLNEAITGNAFTDFEGFFRDGWTVTVGAGRQITEDLAASLAVTWDQGVGTGFDVFSDTWTLAGGVSYDLNDQATIRSGGALIYFTEGEQTQGDFRGVAGAEVGYALSSSLAVKF